MTHQNKAIIFSAPSGAGKTTIVQHLARKFPNLEFSISATTRAPRITETDGDDYYFLSEDQFTDAIEKNQFLEWEQVYSGLKYGTFKSELARIWKKGNHVLFDVDVKGGFNLKTHLGGQALAIFVQVKNIGILKQRLITRQTESQDQIELRVAKALEENEMAAKFDYIIVNDHLQTALDEAEQLVSKFLVL